MSVFLVKLWRILSCRSTKKELKMTTTPMNTHLSTEETFLALTRMDRAEDCESREGAQRPRCGRSSLGARI